MQDSKTREKILKKIRAALIHQTPNRFPKLDFDSPIHNTSENPMEVEFAEQFKRVNGHFVYCEDELEFAESLVALSHELGLKKVYTSEDNVKKILNECDFPYFDDEDSLVKCPTAITCCEFLVARTGTILISSRQQSGRKAPVFPDYQLVLAYTSQLVPDLKDAIVGMKKRYGDVLPSMISAVTGPSRTADIEKTLVQGAHGPKEIYVFLVDDSTV